MKSMIMIYQITGLTICFFLYFQKLMSSYEMAERKCFFDWKFGCKDNSQRLIEAGSARIQNIIRCSRIYNDEVNILLHEKLQNNADLTIDCHKSCVSSYTSTHHIKVFNKRNHPEPSSYIRLKTRRQSSEGGKFVIIRDCLFCGENVNSRKIVRIHHVGELLINSGKYSDQIERRP